MPENKDEQGGLVAMITAAIEDKLGNDIRIYDVRRRSSITDYFVVASAGSKPQLKAISEHVNVSLKKQGVASVRRGGEPESGWLFLDYVDVVIHLFLPETREYYAIEELWEGKDQ